MKEVKSRFWQRVLVILGAAAVLPALKGLPAAFEEPDAQHSRSGAADILLLQGPIASAELEGFDPHRELSEIRDVIQLDTLRRVLSRYPKRLDPESCETLARMLIEHGRSANIDPIFLAAVIRVESLFSKDAVSHKGARGLMQVMPKTGEELAHRLGMDWEGPSQLHDPEVNVRLGAYYLKRLLSHYRGNYKLALTAYNRGPRNVRRIVTRDGYLGRRYTAYFRKIQQIYRRYLRSLDSPTSALLQLG
ncbi:MAG: lytic transglycosylase domain-containing protein [Deltaproteobacteria bacterium]|nr:lytic transglycosylase domain-containing protein [Deltaproteobacteria bacterium]